MNLTERQRIRERERFNDWRNIAFPDATVEQQNAAWLGWAARARFTLPTKSERKRRIETGD